MFYYIIILLIILFNSRRGLETTEESVMCLVYVARGWRGAFKTAVFLITYFVYKMNLKRNLLHTE